MSNYGPALLVTLLVSAASSAVPPVASDPPKGVVLADDTVTCLQVKGIVDVYVHSLGNDRNGRGRIFESNHRPPLHWQLDHNAFWFSFDWDAGYNPPPPEVQRGMPQRIDLAVFSKDENLHNRVDARFSSSPPPSGWHSMPST